MSIPVMPTGRVGPLFEFGSACLSLRRITCIHRRCEENSVRRRAQFNPRSIFVNTVIVVRMVELVDDCRIIFCSLLGGELALNGVIVS
jgi:hypothetical protein